MHLTQRAMWLLCLQTALAYARTISGQADDPATWNRMRKEVEKRCEDRYPLVYEAFENNVSGLWERKNIRTLTDTKVSLPDLSDDRLEAYEAILEQHDECRVRVTHGFRDVEDFENSRSDWEAVSGPNKFHGTGVYLALPDYITMFTYTRARSNRLFATGIGMDLKQCKFEQNPTWFRAACDEAGEVLDNVMYMLFWETSDSSKAWANFINDEIRDGKMSDPSEHFDDDLTETKSKYTTDYHRAMGWEAQYGELGQGECTCDTACDDDTACDTGSSFPYAPFVCIGLCVSALVAKLVFF